MNNKYTTDCSPEFIDAGINWKMRKSHDPSRTSNSFLHLSKNKLVKRNVNVFNSTVDHFNKHKIVAKN